MTIKFYTHLVYEPTAHFPIGSLYVSINEKDTDFSVVADGRELDIELHPHLYKLIGDQYADRRSKIQRAIKERYLLFFTRLKVIYVHNPNYRVPSEGRFFIPDMTTKITG